MGLDITVPGSDYNALDDYDAKQYLTASGIVDANIKSAVNTFVKGLKIKGLWDKNDYIFPGLATTYNQVKCNLKNPTGETLGLFTNTLNKGFVLTGVGDTAGPTVPMPIYREDLLRLLANGGHVQYFINEDLAATSTLVANLGLVISSNLFAQTSNTFFTLSGSGTSPVKKQLNVLSRTGTLTPRYATKGVFAATITGTTINFYGGGSSLGSSAITGTQNSFTGNLTIGDGKYPVNNTVSFFSFGTTPMSAAEIATYTTLINALIFKVHGIAV